MPHNSAFRIPHSAFAIPALALAHGQTGRLIAALLPWLNEGGRVYCLDGGNCFNPYQLALQARSQGLDPTPLLERVMISRAYTCHQLLEAATTMLGLLADQPVPPLTLILGIDALFLDTDISLGERQRIFARLSARVAELIRRGLPLLATVLNAECGMRNAESNFIYAPFRILNGNSEAPNPEYLIPHSTFRIPHLEA